MPDQDTKLTASKVCECEAKPQKHSLPKLAGCRVGDGERAACRKGSVCPTLPGPRKEPITSWGLGMGPAPKGSNAEDSRWFTGRLTAVQCWNCNNYNSYAGFVKRVWSVLYLVGQESDRVRRCVWPLSVVWTGQTTPHWLAGGAPQTSPQAGQWSRLKKQQVGMKDTGSWCPPHQGREGPPPPGVQALWRAGLVLGALGRCWFSDGTGRASHRLRARSPHGGHPDLGWALQMRRE